MAAAANRQRCYRARRKRGQIIVPVAIDDVAVVEALAAAGLLDPAAKDDRAAIADALARLIQVIVASDA